MSKKNETTPTEIYNPSSGKSSEEAKRHLRQGMKLFVEGEVEASIDERGAAS